MSQEQTPEKQIEQLTETAKGLKVRVFDLQEALEAERGSFGQFVNILAQLLDFDQEKAASLQNYVDEVAYLTGKAERPEAAEEAAEAAEAELVD
ncbi:coil containing protein [Vibrio phage 1.081.O._10N.286.52.C2]|nr:coil containing protein [Vibrio phage 1.081.O._10N.286.52.C2]